MMTKENQSLPSRLRIASRKSDLARIQAYTVGQAIMSVAPHLQIEYQFRESLGDKNLNDPLWKIPEKGVFTQDFHQDLVLDQTDLVVHSWKDLAVEENPETFVTCTMEREDVRDVLFVKKSHFDRIEKSQKLRIYTSSPRRMHHFSSFAKNYLPFFLEQIEFESVRGNIQTRMRKMLEADQIDGMLMAKAGLDRLLSAPQPEFRETQDFFHSALKSLDFMILPITTNPQAPAQGALAIEIKRSRTDLIQLLEKINHRPTFSDVIREREILKSYGGGCHSKIGVSHISTQTFQFTLVQGEIDSQDIQRSDFHSGVALEYQKQFRPDQLFAPHGSDYFDLEHISEKDWTDRLSLFLSQSQTPVAIEIAKESYLNKVAPLKNAFIWSSGLETWKKLAQHRIWVHGSQESFGSLLSRPNHFFGQRVTWGKITHEMASRYPGYQSGGKGEITSLASCRLVEKKEFPDLSQYEAFFWKSGSLFLKAVTEQPSIIKKIHFCGFGETFQIISEFFQQNEKTKSVYQFPNEKIWRHYVTKL